jgi:hypothetical protein
MSDPVQQLRDRIGELEEEIRQLREDTAEVNVMLVGILSRQQAALLMAINKVPMAAYPYLDNVSEGHGKYDRYTGEMHQTLRTKVAVCKLRKRLQPYGIEIKVLRGVGYYMDDADKAKLKTLMEKKDALV